ncbi:MAG: hypothetical protein IJ968_03660 [Clostridia bacterium]|nr:hypothetical protein [Clostridia bacterium]
MSILRREKADRTGKESNRYPCSQPEDRKKVQRAAPGKRVQHRVHSGRNKTGTAMERDEGAAAMDAARL